MSIGLSPDEVDENAVSDDDFAAAMGIDVPEPSTSNTGTDRTGGPKPGNDVGGDPAAGRADRRP